MPGFWAFKAEFKFNFNFNFNFKGRFATGFAC